MPRAVREHHYLALARAWPPGGPLIAVLVCPNPSDQDPDLVVNMWTLDRGIEVCRNQGAAWAADLLAGELEPGFFWVLYVEPGRGLAVESFTVKAVPRGVNAPGGQA